MVAYQIVRRVRRQSPNACLLALLLLLPVAVTAAEIEFLLFPEVRSTDHDGGPAESDKFAVSLDLFASGRLGKARYLAEYFWSEDNHHFERLQLGLDLYADTTAWLGRYHNALGYWHTQYHHGNYLQTSISRPAIAELGALGGYLPSHLSGILIESSRATSGTAGFEFKLAAGLGSELQSSGGHHGGSGTSLHDLDLLEPHAGSHKINLSVRFAYLPDLYGSDQVGVFVTRANIPVVNDHVERIDLLAAGLFANKEWERWRALGAFNYAMNDVHKEHGKESGQFSGAYAQLEFAATPSLMLFGRVEDSFSGINDPYLGQLGQFIYSRQAAGLRFDMTRRQALKLEVSRNEDAHEHFNSISANWSAVFP